MKHFFALLILCTAPALAVAQTTAPAPPVMAPAMPPPDGPMMMRMHGQFEQIHDEERAQILAALSPAHRALLSSLVGQLAVAAKPNPEDVAAKLNAALSASEKQAILSAHQAAVEKIHAMMTAQMGQHPKGAPDAGHLLLMLSGGHPNMMMLRVHDGG